MLVEERAYPRYSSELSATVRWVTGEPVKVMIEDVSVTGLRMRTSLVGEAGQLLRIGLPGGCAPHARIIWCRDGRIACQFLSPLAADDVADAQSHLSG